jgi:hypothetical protein
MRCSMVYSHRILAGASLGLAQDFPAYGETQLLEAALKLPDCLKTFSRSFV